MVRNWKVGEPNLKWSEAVELKPRELGLCLGQREDTGTEAIEVEGDGVSETEGNSSGVLFLGLKIKHAFSSR